jgi:heme/copper-type cytochrome/quinol oxidase subunit 2
VILTEEAFWTCLYPPPRMTIGTSIVLIAVGAILKYAVTAHVSGIDLQTVGTILMIVGIIGLIISLLYTFAWSGRRTRVEHYDDPPPRNPPPPRY